MKNTWNGINTLSINGKKKKKLNLLFLHCSPGTRLRTGGGGIRYSTQFFAFFPQCGSWSQTTSLKRVNDNSITNDPLEISNISNNYSSSVGEKLVLRVPSSSCSFSEYLWLNNNPNSFFFDPVFPIDIEREILCMSIPINKTYGLYLVRTRFYPVLNTLFLAHYHYQHLCARIRRRLSTEINARESNFCLDLQKWRWNWTRKLLAYFIIVYF